MGKNEFKKTYQMIEELAERLFIIEGEVTDLLTSETMQNLNTNIQTGTGAIAVGSVLVGQIGNAALASFAASDEGIDVSDFALEITDKNNQKHYFKGCFPEVNFRIGDNIKVMAEPFTTKYSIVKAVIEQKNQYIWTSQQIIKGRITYRIFWIKLIGGVGIFVMIIFILFSIFEDNGISFLLSQPIFISFFISFFICLFIGWKVGASFDEQSVELEAILKKLDFNKPSQIDLQHYALNDLSWKNKEDNKGYGHERWKDYTYRIDLAKQYDEEKYGKK